LVQSGGATAKGVGARFRKRPLRKAAAKLRVPA